MIVSSITQHFKIKRKDTHTTKKDNILELKKPESFVDDPITDILRSGARKLLAEALEVEIESFLAMYTDMNLHALTDVVSSDSSFTCPVCLSYIRKTTGYCSHPRPYGRGFPAGLKIFCQKCYKERWYKLS